jgi:NADPH-dependent 2,4-dienoyl-CoA reductase/sulfur reductase-like enzyme
LLAEGLGSAFLAAVVIGSGLRRGSSRPAMLGLSCSRMRRRPRRRCTRGLAHRTAADLEAKGMTLRLDTVARRIDAAEHRVLVAPAEGGEEPLEYDAVIVGTGAVPVRPPIDGLDRLDAGDGVHLLHSMTDTFALMCSLEEPSVERVVIVGAGYIGLEMAEALTARGLAVTQVEQLPEVLPTVDPQLGALVHAELERHGVTVSCETRVDAIAGENALGGSREFVGSLGTQVVKVFDLVAARTGLRDHEAVEAGFAPLSVTSEADDRGVLPRQSPDHHALHRRSRHRTAGRRAARRPPRRRDRQADRLSYTPPLGSPWEALQAGAQASTRAAHGPHIDRHLSTSVD